MDKAQKKAQLEMLVAEVENLRAMKEHPSCSAEDRRRINGKIRGKSITVSRYQRELGDN